MSVCLCVCLSASISLEPPDQFFTKFLCGSPVPVGRGSGLLWRRCATLCISGFMDDVTFGRSGPYGDTWLAGLRYRGGVYVGLVSTLCLKKRHPFYFCKNLAKYYPVSIIFGSSIPEEILNKSMHVYPPHLFTVLIPYLVKIMIHLPVFTLF